MTAVNFAKFMTLALGSVVKLSFTTFFAFFFGFKPVKFDRDLADLLDIDRELHLVTKRLTSPTTYFIHLINKDTTLVNSKSQTSLLGLMSEDNPLKKLAVIHLPSRC